MYYTVHLCTPFTILLDDKLFKIQFCTQNTKTQRKIALPVMKPDRTKLKS